MNLIIEIGVSSKQTIKIKAMNHAILRQAVSEFEKLSTDEQNVIAARWLEELKDEQIWSEKFAATTDEQWEGLIESVEQDITKGNVTSLGDFLNEDDGQ